MANALVVYDLYAKVAIHTKSRAQNAFWAAEVSWKRAEIEANKRIAIRLWRQTVVRYNAVASMPGASQTLAARAKKIAAKARYQLAQLKRTN